MNPGFSFSQSDKDFRALLLYWCIQVTVLDDISDVGKVAMMMVMVVLIDDDVGLTATDRVLRIINRSRKGVDTAILMKKTGFNQKKVWNIIHRAYTSGKIKRVGKGLYVGVKEK